MLKDIRSGSYGSYPAELTVFKGSLYFEANDGNNGSELWQSNGTSNGTKMVKDINSSGYASPAELTVCNGTLYFRATDANNGTELWKSDGTSGGTQMVKDISSGSSSANPEQLTACNGTLYFKADNGNDGTELWKSDGTTTGTKMVKDIYSGVDSSFIKDLTVYDDTLYFQAKDGTNGAELWKSDGTKSGTRMLKDINSGSSSSEPKEFAVYNGALYFAANNGSYNNQGEELWKSDGSSNGTQLVANIYSGSYSSYPSNLTVYNGDLYFVASDGSTYSEVWKSDGTSAGTQMVKDINSGSSGSYPDHFTVYDGELYFKASDGYNNNYYELWKTDGTSGGTQMVKDINSGSDGSNPDHLTVYNGNLYFEADNGYYTNGNELWMSDGTSGGTQMVKDINSGSSSAYIRELIVYNGSLYFRADDGNNGAEVWQYSCHWTGGSNTSWSNNSNWEGKKPADTANVYIPNGLSNYPTISSNQQFLSLTLQSGSTPGQINVQSGNTLTIKGNLINNGQSDLGNGTIKMTNSKDSQVLKGSSKSIIDNLTIDNSKGITLENEVEVQSTMTLTSGVLDIPNSNDSLILKDGVNVSGAGNSSYVSGKITKVGDDAFTFPLGDGGQLGELAISNPGSNTVKFTAQYNKNGYGNTTKGPNLNAVSTNEYWNLNEVSTNTPSVQVTLHWENASSQGISQPSDLVVAHWDGNQWNDEGNSSYSSNGSSGSVTSNSMSSFSPFTFGSTSSNNSLPVELMNFYAALKNGKVHLNWATASETNNSHFMVQKRINEDWQNIGRVEGHGTTAEKQRYSFEDPEFSEGQTSYYRLKQVDFDGSHEYSDIRSVRADETSSTSVSIYPNPVSEELNFEVDSENQTEIRVILRDIYGQEMYRSRMRLSKGENGNTIPVNHMGNGQYILILKNEHMKVQQRFMKVE